MIDEDKRSGLNVALNESALLSVQVDSSQWTAIVWLSALTLDDHGDQPKDATFGLLLTGVTRVAASLRDGRWDDEAAAVRELRLDQLDESIREFGEHRFTGGSSSIRPKRRGRTGANVSVSMRCSRTSQLTTSSSCFRREAQSTATST